MKNETSRAEVVGLGLDEFLGHKANAGGSGGFLRNWRKEGSVEVYLHRTAPIYPLWAHGWYEVVEVEDKDGGGKTRKVFHRRFVSHERPLILAKARFREADGSREYPPEVCPASLLIEAVYQKILKGELSWTDPIFEFKGDDEDYSVVMLAGGMTGMFQNPDLTKQQQAELRKAGVRRDEAFKQNFHARCQYVLSVVDAKDPSAGVQTTMEATSLGDKLKLAIKHELKRRKDKGNPGLNPYPFEWTYDESKSFSDKYDVVALEDEPSAEVLRLISGDPPDLSDLVTPSNCMAFRAQVEAYLVDGVDLPLDEIFAPAEKAGLMTPPASPPKTVAKAVRTPEVSTKAKLPPATPGKGAAKAAAPEPEGSLLCDHCDADMAEAAVACEGCGATYDGDRNLTGRPCLASECSGLVLLEGAGPFICPDCGAIHETCEDPDPERAKEGLLGWRVKPKEEKPVAGRRRRGGSSETVAGKA